MVLVCQAEQPADQMKPNLLFLSQLDLGNSPVTVGGVEGEVGGVCGVDDSGI